MRDDWAQQAALIGLHGLDYEVWSRLFARAERAGENRWQVAVGQAALAQQCGGCSQKTIQRAVRRLRQTGWLAVSGRTSRVAVTAFTLAVPADLHRARGPAQPPAIDAFSKENREAFLLMKNTLTTDQLADLEDAARQWLVARGTYNTTTHRDKLDELIMRKLLGPVRAEACQPCFDYLYA
jgi:hypothetical protein